MLKANEKIRDSLYRIHNYFPFYYEILCYANFKKETFIPTMGVKLTNTGIEVSYNEEFVNSLPDIVLGAILLHESFHVLYHHHKRTSGLNPAKANIVQDMIINSSMDKYVLHEHVRKEVASFEDQKIYYIPQEYEGKWIFENLYLWLQEKSNERNEERKKSGNPEKDHPGLSKETNKVLDHFEQAKSPYLVDVHSEDDSDLPESLKQEMIESIISKIKHRGFSSGEIEKVLEILRPKKHNWFKSFKKSFESSQGSIRNSTWSKPNRKNLPLKGFKKEGTMCNIILDTSGSMENEISKVLPYMLKQEIEYNLIQVDTDVKKIDKRLNDKKFKKVSLKGFGGTTLQPGVDLVVEKFNNYPTVLLTDGYCDKLDLTKLKKEFIILTTDKKVEYSGKVKKQIVIEG